MMVAAVSGTVIIAVPASMIITVAAPVTSAVGVAMSFTVWPHDEFRMSAVLVAQVRMPG